MSSASESPPDDDVQSARVLIVDDEVRNRELLKVMLMSEGVLLDTADSGEEALAMVARDAPDLILLDVMLPGIDGYEVTTRLKGNAATRNIPVVMITSLDDHEARMRGLNAGAEDFLTRPVDRSELRARVRNLLRLKAALEAADDARAMAEQANNAKTLFLRTMSHELRTPLNAISGYTELLEMGIRGSVNPAQLLDLGRIKRASAYLLRLINDVLAVARQEGVRPLNTIALALHPVLVEVEGLCALQANAKGVTLIVHPASRELVALADAERFQQILLNVIVNAIKFTTSGGSIDVTSDEHAGKVRVRVTDTGVGVRSPDWERVFEPFVQVDRHLTADSLHGIGLGLSISREFARAMLGDLTLESEAGVGSTLTLTLPMAPAAGAGQNLGAHAALERA